MLGMKEVPNSYIHWVFERAKASQDEYMQYLRRMKI
jgi:hypothetical protein